MNTDPQKIKTAVTWDILNQFRRLDMEIDGKYVYFLLKVSVLVDIVRNYLKIEHF